jgi:hypothetical protein
MAPALDRDQRNLTPHKWAVAAMYLWGSRYSQQNGGSMDFWDTLDPFEKRLCKDLVNAINKAPIGRDEA